MKMMKMTTRIISTSAPFQKLEHAQEYLRDNGWTDLHQGNWRHPQRPGVNRDIRKQGDEFFIYQTEHFPLSLQPG